MSTHGSRRDGTRGAAILRALAAHPEGLLTTELLTDELLATVNGKRDPRQRALTRLGGILRGLNASGHVRLAGQSADTGWQRCPIHRWAITGKGIGLLYYWDTGPHQTDRAVQAAAYRERRAELLALLEQTAKEHGPGAPRSERQEVARQLRAEGASLRQIGNIFGVTGQTIHNDLYPRARKPRPAASRSHVRVRGPRGRRLRAFRGGMLDKLDVVTYTEW